jgi:hypothetical protein
VSAGIDAIENREQAAEYLEGYSRARSAELGARATKSPLLKSYLLETGPPPSSETDLPAVFGAAGVRLDPIEDGLYRLWDPIEAAYVGLVEQLIPRYPVIYTNELAEKTDELVPRIVAATPLLDHLWLSGIAFNCLWNRVVKLNSGARYGRLVFEHQSVFETTATWGVSEQEEDLDERPRDSGTERGDQLVEERRASRFTIVDRLDVLNAKLSDLQRIYAPLYSISQLRFPATGRGGHDFYYSGKVTNRSDSFADHRAHLKYVVEIYKAATERAEDEAWYSQDEVALAASAAFTAVRGAPVVLRFAQPLDVGVFERWVSTLGHKRGRFRLWGTPFHVAAGAVHMYGADRHLWQPLFLEITRHHLVAVLPRGTCGNTIHRLVTNVQHFIDPAVQAWVGDQPYGDFLKSATDSQRGGPGDRV